MPMSATALAVAEAASDTSANQDFAIRPLNGPLGAEILNLDLSVPLTRHDFQRIHRAHLDHHLLIFRNQRITPQQQIDFSRLFGPLQIHVLHVLVPAAVPAILSGLKIGWAFLFSLIRLLR